MHSRPKVQRWEKARLSPGSGDQHPRLIENARIQGCDGCYGWRRFRECVLALGESMTLGHYSMSKREH